MLSVMALKVLSVSMSLSTRTTSNTFLINITKEEEFGNNSFQMFSDH